MAQAAQFSKADLARMAELINNTYTMTGALGEENLTIDVLNSPMTEAQMVKFGLYYTYSFDKSVHHVTNGTPLKLYKDMEPFTNYALVSIKAVTKLVERNFGYKWSIPEDSLGQVYGYPVANGCFILGESDAGMNPELVPVSVKRDGYGLVRVICEQEDIDNEKNKFRYSVVLKEQVIDGEKAWQILLIKALN